MGAPESHYDWLRLLDKRLDRGLVALGGPPYSSVVTTDRRFHLDFDGHSWPDLMEPGWEPTETGGVIFLGWEHMCGVLRKDSEGQYRATFDKAVQIAEGTTNLIVNPSAETDVANWGPWNAGLAQTADDYVYGDYCFEMLATAVDGYVRSAIAVAGGSTHTASAWVKTTSNLIQLRLYDAVAPGIIATATAQGTGDWEYLTCTGIMGAGAGNLYVMIQDKRAAGWDDILFDAAQLELRAYNTPYVDGSLGSGHSWTGASHASTSTRAAATLTYPNDVVAYPDGDCYEQLTIAGWFIPAWDSDVLTAAAAVFFATTNFTGYYDPGTDTWRLWLQGANRLTSPVQSFSSWEPQHLAFVVDFDADTFALYVNGELADSQTIALAPHALGATDFHVGRETAATRWTNGLIDDFVIYPRVLSADEIKSIYKFGNPLQPPTHANMRVIFGDWESSSLYGNVYATTAWTTLDIVDDFGIPFGAKAVSMRIIIDDFGGAGQGSFNIRKDATDVGDSAWSINGDRSSLHPIIRVANGRTIDYSITAIGPGATLQIWPRIRTIWL